MIFSNSESMRREIADLINIEQNKRNLFINVSEDDLHELERVIWSKDLDRDEQIKLFEDLGFI